LSVVVVGIMPPVTMLSSTALRVGFRGFPQASSRLSALISPPNVSRSSTIQLISVHFSSSSSSVSAPTNVEQKTIRIKRDLASLNNEQTAVKSPKEQMSGYKYRFLSANVLTTSQLKAAVAAVEEEALVKAQEDHAELLNTSNLTDDLTTSLPKSQIESRSLPTNIPTTLQVREKENYYVHLLQQQYDNDDLKDEPNNHIRSGIKSVFKNGLWTTIRKNMDNTQKVDESSKYSKQPPQSSMRSRRSSVLLDEMINNDSYTGFLPAEQHNMELDEAISGRVRVRSVQTASSIDVVAVLNKVFGGGARDTPYPEKHPLADFFATSPPLRHVFGRTNIIIQLSPPPSDGHPSLSLSVPRYVVVYRFGAVVFFNLTTKESSRLLEQIKKYSANPIPIGFERREHFEVALHPQLETATGKITSDRALVKELDMNTVGIVSNIMGQTVALDWYNDTVDELLARFSSVNSSVERTGSFTNVERNTLFQVVAKNNSLFIDLVGKLGLKDRSDTAWHLSQYEGLHEGMRKEFELDERFRNVEFKLDLIQQNAKFFLEVIQDQKSNALEWVIVILISFECGLMMLDMSGKGGDLMAVWTSFF
jgi:uncharacterized Rmd1/YagE family protein